MALFLTKTAKASSKLGSLGTSIVSEIVGQFYLETHNILTWKIDEEKNMIKKWDEK